MKTSSRLYQKKITTYHGWSPQVNLKSTKSHKSNIVQWLTWVRSFKGTILEVFFCDFIPRLQDIWVHMLLKAVSQWPNFMMSSHQKHKPTMRWILHTKCFEKIKNWCFEHWPGGFFLLPFNHLTKTLVICCIYGIILPKYSIIECQQGFDHCSLRKLASILWFFFSPTSSRKKSRLGCRT